MASALVLTFHAIGRYTGCEAADGPTVERYTLPVERFAHVVNAVRPEVCCTASQFARQPAGEWLLLTFDDGLVSDYEIVLHALKGRGIRGTFFVTVGNVGRRGYTSGMQLREMIAAGMEIGSHGLTHRYLVTMPRAEALRELSESKTYLEQELGVQVSSYAPVGGHFRRWMLEAARAAGYRTFATMIPGWTRGGKDFVALRRNHIQAHHEIPYIDRVLRGHSGTLAWNWLRYRVLSIPKVILGLRQYERVKGRLLRSLAPGQTQRARATE